MTTATRNATRKGSVLSGYLSAMLLCGAILSTGAALGQETSFPATLDEAYSGSLTFDVFPADGGSRIHRSLGTAEVVFSTMPDGAIQFTTNGETEESDFEISIELKESEDGIWRSSSPGSILQIDQDGQLLYTAHKDGFDHAWSGSFTHDKGQLTLRRFPTATAQGDVVLVFVLDVQRARSVPDSAPASGDDSAGGDGSCTRIEWRLVNRWTWGGGLRLDRQPVCVQ